MTIPAAFYLVLVFGFEPIMDDGHLVASAKPMQIERFGPMAKEECLDMARAIVKATPKLSASCQGNGVTYFPFWP